MLFSVLPTDLSVGNIGITWELAEMQNLGRLTQYLLQSLAVLQSLASALLKSADFINGSSSSGTIVPFLLGV